MLESMQTKGDYMPWLLYILSAIGGIVAILALDKALRELFSHDDDDRDS